jgi:hypothetical protein
MNRFGHRRTALGIMAALLAVGVGLAAAPAQASTASLMSQSDVRKKLLTLKEIKAITGVTVAADSVECHHNPYIVKTYVNYCYYGVLHSDSAYAASRLWPNHVDIIAFESTKLARDYVQGMKKSRTTSTLLSSTPSTAVFYDKDGFIATPTNNSGQVATTQGPTVTVFSYRGRQAVYVACTDPKAISSALLQKCATDLAKAQLKKIG